MAELKKSELLEVKNLSVSFFSPQGEICAVRDVSFSLKRGEVLAIVGESGCGKSALCKSVMKLLPEHAKIKSGSILINGADITNYGEREMQRLRGSLFSMVFQNPLTALNPTMSVGRQIVEAVRLHRPKLSHRALEERALELLELVEIDRPKERLKQYPYHLSGGQRQRVVMAIALAGNPDILFADEPTTALDVTIQAQILNLFKSLQKKLGTATVFVSHDLGVVAKVADRVAVMYAGKIVEIGTAGEVYHDPRHPYTWGLMRSLPSMAKGRDILYTIPGMPPALRNSLKGDAFACRNEYALAIDYEKEPPMFRVTDTHYAATWLLDERAPKVESPFGKRAGSFKQENRDFAQTHARKSPESAKILPEPAETLSENFSGGQGRERKDKEILLDVRHLSHSFPLAGGGFIKAVDDVSFQIRRGEIFGLVGESGSGKSTLARCVMNIYKHDGGSILYKGIDAGSITRRNRAFWQNRKILQSTRQIIFQDSDSSLNPRMKVCDIIAEPMKLQKRTPPRGSFRAEAEFQMHYVGLDADYLDKYPPELSGGQRQRVAIARALSMEPELLVADEPVASLDVSIQAQIINLFRHLQREHGFAFLFISHDLSVVEFLCDRVGVMYQGRLVEAAPVRELFENPRHPYTKSLIAAIPVPDPGNQERPDVRA
ncbi:ABC transporter ATP-binding protein [bacterium 1xD8-48]|nr:ABC transporter ATP-binding protein [Lachnospiraceae bacterium]NBJ96024.1 ABC transporter ATP-binding protein [bacterium 1xD8-48]